jgi:N-acetylglucosamine kinase-like BadF-type ATPase
VKKEGLGRRGAGPAFRTMATGSRKATRESERGGALLVIEGGGSKARAAFAMDGRVMARRVEGGLNPNDIGRAVLERRLRVLVMPLLESASRPPRLFRVVAAVAGVGRPDACEICRSALRSVLEPGYSVLKMKVITDAEALLECRFAGRDGIVLIAGTGSVCLGMRRGVRRGLMRQAGGWGSYHDRGSGFRLGLDLVDAALETLDAGKEATGAVAVLCQQRDINLEDVPLIFLSASREETATLARVVLDAARRGDPQARKWVRSAARDLVDLTLTVRRRLGLRGAHDVLISGGLFRSPWFSSAFKRALRRKLPRAELVEVSDPLAFLLLAYLRQGL